MGDNKYVTDVTEVSIQQVKDDEAASVKCLLLKFSFEYVYNYCTTGVDAGMIQVAPISDLCMHMHTRNYPINHQHLHLPKTNS